MHNGITRFGKVCFELHETDFAAQNPCRMFGRSCSKVAIPVADFTLRFLFLFSIAICEKGKNNRPTSLLIMKIGRSLSYLPFWGGPLFLFISEDS